MTKTNTNLATILEGDELSRVTGGSKPADGGGGGGGMGMGPAIPWRFTGWKLTWGPLQPTESKLYKLPPSSPTGMVGYIVPSGQGQSRGSGT